jgi:four helix bundle protein
MKAKKFEDLIIWQEARELIKSIYNLTRKYPLQNDFGLREQIQRASVSIMNNIAEGFERDNNNEFIRFLVISKGSAGELRSLLYVILDLEYITKKEFEECYQRVDIIIRKISKFINYLVEFKKK